MSKELYSYSKISTYKLCPKKYEYSYLKNLRPLIDDNKNLFLGGLLHKGIELKDTNLLLNYIDNEAPTPTEESETLISLGLAMVEGYFNRFGYYEKVINEIHFEIPLADGSYYHGYIDGLIEEDNGYWLLEIKTASIIDKTYIDKLAFNEQIDNYFYAIKNGYLENIKLDKPLLGIKYRILKKPLIRQKQKESIMEFRKRLVEKMADPEYIIEKILYRTEEQTEQVINYINQDISNIKNTKIFTKTLTACSTFGRCPYMELCAGEPDADHLYIIKEERSTDDVTGE